MNKFIFRIGLGIVGGLILTILGSARMTDKALAAYEPVSDCVIQDFSSAIQVNKDASANIEETLLVDCGDLPSKHGIFRILPTQVNRGKNVYPKTPIRLVSITDENNSPRPFTTIANAIDHTLTWKIGDPNMTISGLNVYKISYRIGNVVIPSDNGTALYLNLNGSFWELPINNFEATVKLPDGANKDNTTLKLYSGDFGSVENSFAKSNWDADGKSFTVTANEIPTQTGITTWAEFPTGIVKLFQPSWLDLYGQYLWLILIPLASWLAFRIWNRHGKDPRFKGPIMVMFEPPKDTTALEGGMLMNYGTLSPKLISATIVDLAVRGYIKITEIKGEGWLVSKDWQLEVLRDDLSDLKPFEQKLLNGLFGDVSKGAITNISDQKNEFYKEIPGIQSRAYTGIKDWFDPQGTGWLILFLIVGILFVVGGVGLGAVLASFIASVSVVLSGIIFVIFGILMPRRTKSGSQALYELEGFKLYMKQAETYRMRFYEQEGIFEKYLPFAIMFGLTGIWAKAFASIYQEKTGSMYVPIWYVGMGGGFDPDAFSSRLNDMSSSMASTLASNPSSSGSGAGGFSGGGGGGGGGGSW